MTTEKKKWQAVAKAQKEVPSVYDLPRKKALELGLWCLFVSKTKFDSEYLTYDKIENILADYLDIPMTSAKLKKSFAPAFGTKIIKRKDAEGCKISATGEAHLKALNKSEHLNVIYVNPAKPREASKNLEGLIKTIPKGELLICDPFYGINTLDVLEEFVAHHTSIRFLTKQRGAKEKSTALATAIAKFNKQHSAKVEMRVAATRDFHDRYIISTNTFLIIGHGLMDLGSKESLIVVVPDQSGRDIRRTLVAGFEIRWATATAL